MGMISQWYASTCAIIGLGLVVVKGIILWPSGPLKGIVDMLWSHKMK